MKFSFNPLTAEFELQQGGCSSSEGSSASSPAIQNVTITNANVETEITLPIGTKRFLIKVRGYESSLKFSYVAGASGTNYISITRGCSYTEEDILTVTGNTKIYVQSTKPNVVVECLTWA